MSTTEALENHYKTTRQDVQRYVEVGERVAKYLNQTPNIDTTIRQAESFSHFLSARLESAVQLAILDEYAVGYRAPLTGLREKHTAHFDRIGGVNVQYEISQGLRRLRHLRRTKRGVHGLQSLLEAEMDTDLTATIKEEKERRINITIDAVLKRKDEGKQFVQHLIHTLQNTEAALHITQTYDETAGRTRFDTWNTHSVQAYSDLFKNTFLNPNKTYEARSELGEPETLRRVSHQLSLHYPRSQLRFILEYTGDDAKTLFFQTALEQHPLPSNTYVRLPFWKDTPGDIDL